MENKTCLIRADANAGIGAGHVMRCLALAFGLKNHGWNVSFASIDLPETLHAKITKAGFEVKRLAGKPGAQEDLNRTLVIAEGSDAIVLDGYQFQTQFQSGLRRKGFRLLAFDDISDQAHYKVDLLLNQNIYANKEMYRDKTDAKLLLGTAYCLLRPEFLAFSDLERETKDEAQRILVTMGGGDPDNATSKVLAATNQLKRWDLDIKVVVGSVNPNKDAIEASAKEARCKVEIVVDPQNIPELMAEADLAVTAAGSTVWEVAFMGLPALSLTIAKNQMLLAEGADAAGLTVNLGWHQSVEAPAIAENLQELLDSPKKRAAMSATGRRYVDGKGAERVANELTRACLGD